jgi:uncharacterized membrane protein (Fun14 family)
MIERIAAPLGIGSMLGLAISFAIQATAPSVPVTIVPTINLVAILTGAVYMGMLLNRVKQLERRLDKVEEGTK